MTRSVAVPGNGIVLGAIAADKPPLIDRRLAHALGVTPDDLAAEVERQRAELHHREPAYRHGRQPLPPTGGTVVLVADGTPGGPTARAAVHALHHQQPASSSRHRSGAAWTVQSPCDIRALPLISHAIRQPNWRASASR